MENPKISVIIPVYNGEKTLDKCLESVLSQTYENYEVIVVDNNSNDKTKQIISEFQKKDRRVIYVFKPRKGRGAARNAGILNAKGDIIVTTDSDCIVPQNWLRMLISPIAEGKEEAVMGFEHNADRGFWSKNIQQADWNHYKKNISGQYINLIDTKNFAIKADLIKKIMFDENLEIGEDIDLYLRLKNLAKIRFFPEIKVEHFHKNSFLKYVKMQMDRGYWMHKIHKKYKKTELKNDPAFRSFSLTNNFLIIPFLLKKLIIKPKEFIFYSVSEICWRVGVLKAYIL